jgi:hypothetical protein
VYRFSSKEWNGNSGLYYYLYRFYDPNLQRWVNRDPFCERGFDSIIFGMLLEKIEFSYLQPSEYSDDANLYGFVTDDPINDFDVLGLRGSPSHPAPPLPPNHPPGPPRGLPRRPPCPPPTEKECHAAYLRCVDVGIAYCGSMGFVPVVGIPMGIGCGIFFNHFCDNQEKECLALSKK